MKGVEDGVGSDEEGEIHPVQVSARFIEQTGIYSFAPAIGTAHGLYKSAAELRPERVSEIIELHPIPMVLHGGTGLTQEQFTDLISRGCAKVNISTALKILAFVVLGILGDVAELTRLLDPGRDLAATGCRELLELGLQIAETFWGEDDVFRHRLCVGVLGRSLTRKTPHNDTGLHASGWRGG